MATIGETDYRDGAQERLKEALVLLRHEKWAGSIYLAGRAVEGMLRAVIWKGDPDYPTGRKLLSTGHDLRNTLNLLQNLGLLRVTELGESIRADVQKVGRLWSNNMRYWPTKKVSREWYNLRAIGPKRTIKKEAVEFWVSCSTIIRKCEAIWPG